MQTLVCDGCDGLLGMGRGVGCRRGANCGCECHVWDCRTCAEIVIAHKRAAPQLNVAKTSGMHRMQLLQYLDDNLSANQITRAVEINLASPDYRDIGAIPISDNCMVPLNISELAGSVSPVAVVELDAGHLSKPKLALSRKGPSLIVNMKGGAPAAAKSVKTIDKADDLLSASQALIKSARLQVAPALKTKVTIRKPQKGKMTQKKACRRDT